MIVRGRVLGIDVGSVRVGVAMSDPLGITAQPLTVTPRRGAAGAVAQLAAENEAQTIVVGYPLTLAGKEGPATQAVDTFISELQRRTEIPIERWDERLTTAQAERSMIALGMRRSERREKIDRTAAQLILQSFLDAHSS